MASQYKALSVQFEGIGETTAISIKDLVTSSAPKGAPTCQAAADQIWLWDSANADWVKYFYYKKGTAGDIWCKKGETTETTDTIANGETFFFYRGSGAAVATLTLSGGVKPFAGKPEYSGLVATQYRFLGYPWPTAMPIAGFQNFQGDPKGAPTCQAASDQIWLWDTANADWVKYFFYKKGTAGNVWCKKGETTETTDVIPAGEGFFFYRGSGASTDTITFTFGE